MGKRKDSVPSVKPDVLFDRIVSILEEARGSILRAVNTGMVTAYWLIGREIVLQLQGGTERAEYGHEVIENLSTRLTVRYGRGFSEVSLQRFRKLYLVYRERLIIPSPPGTESDRTSKSSPPGRKSAPEPIQYPAGTKIS